MKIAGFSTLIYGVLVLAGGLFGYVQARSLPSLVTGVPFGIVLILSGWYMWAGSVVAAYVGGVITLFLAFFFAYRFTATGRFMPGGLMLALSFVAIVILVAGVFNSLRQ